MYYLESKEPRAAGGTLPARWRPICYGSQREPLDATVKAFGSEKYRVTTDAERRYA